MLNETRVEGIAIHGMEAAINALIETQVILQFLVKKKICTIEEVNAMRNVVRTQPKYKSLLLSIENAQNRIDEESKFEDLFEKSLKPGGNKNLTDEEREYLLGKIDGMTKEFAKEAKDKYGDW